MFKLFKRSHSKTELAGLIAIIFGIGLFLDAIIRGGLFFAIIIAILFLFIGQRQRNKGKSVTGSLFLLIGFLLLVGNILTSIAFQLVFVSLLIYYGYHLYKGQEQQKKVEVEILPSSTDAKSFIQVEPYFKNMLVGNMRHIDEAYELDDINIQYGFGDVHLDLSYTIIPEGETVIMVRGMIGNIHLYVPYDIDLSLHTSSLFGKINLLEHDKTNFNTTSKFQTKDYKTATRRIKIIASLLVGDIEVRNV